MPLSSPVNSKRSAKYVVVFASSADSKTTLSVASSVLLRDYLNGNVYFKTTVPEQNLNRARVQFRLCESVEARERSIRGVLRSL